MSRLVALGCLFTLLAGCGTMPTTAQRLAPSSIAARAQAPVACVARLAPAATTGLTAALTASFVPAVPTEFRYVEAVTFSNGHMGITGFCTLTKDGVARKVIFWTTYDPATGQLDPDATTTDNAAEYGACGDG
ncbi:MAG: hypothetical protein JWM80_3257 [Cyanobacteria bacterium RYN_339]|nr:hypothetical protein [Cyanobacteria bacterium RYN_339]